MPQSGSHPNQLSSWPRLLRAVEATYLPGLLQASLRLKNYVPVPLMVVNQAGGSGLVGTTIVAQAKGNAHILLTFIPGQASATGGGEGGRHFP